MAWNWLQKGNNFIIFTRKDCLEPHLFPFLALIRTQSEKFRLQVERKRLSACIEASTNPIPEDRTGSDPMFHTLGYRLHLIRGQWQTMFGSPCPRVLWTEHPVAKNAFNVLSIHRCISEITCMCNIVNLQPGIMVFLYYMHSSFSIGKNART